MLGRIIGESTESRFKIKKLHEDVEIPCYVHKGDAGMDIRACQLTSP